MRRLLQYVLALLTVVPLAAAWTWPVDGPVLQRFAFDRGHPYDAGEHRGIAIGAADGSPVVAPAAGTISFAGTVPSSGKSVTIETADGLSVSLTHLGAISVARGAAVAEGGVVGSVGTSGVPELDVPYVHLGIRTTADDQGYLDPLGFLPSAARAPTVPAPPASPPSAPPPPAPVAVAAQPAPAPPAPAPRAQAPPAPAPRAAAPPVPVAASAAAAAVPASASPAAAPAQAQAPPAAAPPVDAAPAASPPVAFTIAHRQTAGAPIHAAQPPVRHEQNGRRHVARHVSVPRVVHFPRAVASHHAVAPPVVHARGPQRPHATAPAARHGRAVAVSARSSMPIVLVLLASLAGVALVVAAALRMIKSPSSTVQGATAELDAAEDPRRPGLAIRQWPAPHRPRGGLRRAGGRLRSLSPAEGQRRLDGERDGRARDAGDGLRRPKRRVPA